MNPKKIKDCFDFDCVVINKANHSLPVSKMYKYDEVITWVSDCSRLLTNEADGIRQKINVKKLNLLPKDKKGSVAIHSFLQSYLKKHYYKLKLSDLEKSVDSFQRSTQLKTNELMFIPDGLRLILFNRISQVLNKTFAKKSDKLDILELRNAIESFTAYQKIDWQIFFEKTSPLEKILNKDPSKIYPMMDSVSRHNYRHIVEELSLRSGKSEMEIANNILQKTIIQQRKGKECHVGSYLYAEKKYYFEQEINCKYSVSQKISRFFTRSPILLYFPPLFVLTIFGLFLVAKILLTLRVEIWLGVIYLLLFVVPIIIIAKYLTDYILSKTTKPKALLKMDFKHGIPSWAKTILVVPTQLGPLANEPLELLSQLENNYLNNQTKNLYFALLLAFKDTKDINDTVTIEEQSNLDKIKMGIKQLNLKYSKGEPIFFAFSRSRSWNEKEKANIEWERKRGKLIEFNRLLRGEITSFNSDDLDYNFLSLIKYVITVDRNDLLTKGAAIKLSSIIAHPLNKAIIDPTSKVVTSGYGLIQPQMLCRQSKTVSLLEQVFGDNKNWSSYSGVASEVYQDLFGTSLFMGKGIYDIDVFRQVLENRFPENAVLSHDHLEGFYIRSGYASDIQILEDNPVSYLSYTTRLTRWARGDWQNILWLFNSVKDESGQLNKNPLSYFARFNLLENILSTLFLPSLFLVIWVTIFIGNWANSAIIFLSFGCLIFQPSLSLVDFMISNRITLVWKEYAHSLFVQLKVFILQIIFKLIFFGHLSFLTMVGVVKTIYRMLISKKHLLEWQIFRDSTGHKSRKIFGVDFEGFCLFELFCLLALIVLNIFGTTNMYFVSFVVFSMTTPIWAKIFSYASLIERNPKNIIGKDWFNCLAIKTWRYFDETVSEQTNYLPPDRIQLDDGHLSSHMTSITNIGLYLLSLQVAASSNFISIGEYLKKSQQLFDTLDKMDRFKGHFFNWYNIKTLEALPPKYVSSVDSGNFVASLLTAEIRFKNLKNENICSKNFWSTVKSILTLYLKAIDNNKNNIENKKHREAIFLIWNSLPDEDIANVRVFYNKLKNINKELTKHLAVSASSNQANSLRYWADKSLTVVGDKIKEIELFYPWFISKNITKDLVFLDFEKQSTSSGLRGKINLKLSSGSINSETKKMLRQSIVAIDDAIAKSDKLSSACKKIYDSTDLKFIYDKKKKLFYVAYDSVNERFDKYHYGSFGSEARLTSFISIALNQVPIEHWHELSRTLVASKGGLAMLSWGGSLFEYLFPQIFMGRVHGSFADKISKSAVISHINFAHAKNIPWGISESCYNQKNEAGDYQYSIHGVPSLSTRLAHDKNMVVSPYSSFLALELFPRETYKNLKWLEADGAGGKYGFYESVDYNGFTDLALEAEPVKAYLCHHQSIILLSIYNYLSSGDLRKSFNGNSAVKSLDFMLSEKVGISKFIRSAKEMSKVLRPYIKLALHKNYKTETNFTKLPLMNLLSNGKYSIYLTDHGGGFSRFKKYNLNPWQADPTLSNQGNQIYIWDDNNKDLIMSLSPLLYKDGIKQTSVAIKNEVTFDLSNKELVAKLKVGLMDNQDLEYRVLSIKNPTMKTKKLKIAYCSEQVLSNGFEDIKHPSFNRLRTKVECENNSWLYSKRQMPGEPNIYAGYKTFINNPSVALRVLTSRRDFIGRLPDDLAFAVSGRPYQFSVSSYGLIYGNVAEITLRPFKKCKIIYLTVASYSRNEAIRLLNQYKSFNDASCGLKNNTNRKKQNTVINYELEKKLLSLLIFKRSANILNTKTADNNHISIIELRNKIGACSGNPILLTRVDSKTPESSFRKLVMYSQLLANKGFSFNLVILTLDKDDYFNTNLNFVQKLLLETVGDEKSADKFKKLLIINEKTLSVNEISSLKKLSTLYINLNEGSFVDQIESEYEKL